MERDDYVRKSVEIEESDLISLTNLFKTEKSNQIRVVKTSEGVYLSENSLSERDNLSFQVLSPSD